MDMEKPIRIISPIKRQQRAAAGRPVGVIALCHTEVSDSVLSSRCSLQLAVRESPLRRLTWPSRSPINKNQRRHLAGSRPIRHVNRADIEGVSRSAAHERLIGGPTCRLTPFTHFSSERPARADRGRRRQAIEGEREAAARPRRPWVPTQEAGRNYSHTRPANRRRPHDTALSDTHVGRSGAGRGGGGVAQHLPSLGGRAATAARQ